LADNSTDDNSNLVDMDDLNAFEKDFYQEPTDEVETEEVPTEDEEVDENEDGPLATEEDEDAPAETEDEEQAEEKEAPKPKPKSKLQTRIDELVEKARLADESRVAEKAQRELLERQLAEFKTRKPEVNAEADPTLQEQLPPEAPQPNALDDKGEPIYELGEFDPKFIRDLTKFTIEQETKAATVKAEQEAKVKEVAAAQEALNKSWNERVEKVVEELPDYREKIAEMGKAFEGIDPQYGDYLATTIMQCDNGPEIMYYLSQNIGEAQRYRCFWSFCCNSRPWYAFRLSLKPRRK
jgi:hypothetical protein